LANSFTSFATTAKPLPAFAGARGFDRGVERQKLVCCAIDVMTLMTFSDLSGRITQLRHSGCRIVGNFDGGGRDFRSLRSVLGNLPYAGAHFFRPGGDSLEVLADSLRGFGNNICLGRGLYELAVIC